MSFRDRANDGADDIAPLRGSGRREEGDDVTAPHAVFFQRNNHGSDLGKLRGEGFLLAVGVAAVATESIAVVAGPAAVDYCVTASC